MTQAPPRQQWVTERAAPAGEDDDGADRGRLEIAPAALRRIAEHASDLVPGTTRVRRRIAGVRVGEQGASAQLRGPERELRVRLDVALHYPSPAHQVVGQVRESVSEELAKQAGCRVRSVDVTVSALVPAGEAPRVG